MSQTFAAAVATTTKGGVLPGEAVIAQFRPEPPATTEELARQLVAAQTHHYAGAYDKALDTVSQAIESIERLWPHAEPWKLMTQALLLKAVVLKSLGRNAEALEAQKRVLRIDPAFKLDTDYYTPTAVQAFERLRTEMRKVPKRRLVITSSPTAAQVFVDGANVGKTPFVGQFPSGSYRLWLAAGEKISFVRQLALTRDEAHQIDLDFEGAVSASPPLCVNGEPAQVLDFSLRLGALAGADSVVVLKLESRNNEPGWVNATLFEVSKGTKVREGGVRFVGPRREVALSALAGFLLTGTPSASVVEATGLAPPGPKDTEPMAPAPWLAPPNPPPAASQVAASAPAQPPQAARAVTFRGRGPRAVSFVLMGAGAITCLGGAALYSTTSGDRASLARLVDAQGNLRAGANAEEAKAVQRRLGSATLSAAAVVSVGAAALVAGVVVFFALPPQRAGATTVSLVPSRDGLWVGATGHF